MNLLRVDLPSAKTRRRYHSAPCMGHCCDFPGQGQRSQQSLLVWGPPVLSVAVRCQCSLHSVENNSGPIKINFLYSLQCLHIPLKNLETQTYGQTFSLHGFMSSSPHRPTPSCLGDSDDECRVARVPPFLCMRLLLLKALSMHCPDSSAVSRNHTLACFPAAVVTFPSHSALSVAFMFRELAFDHCLSSPVSELQASSAGMVWVCLKVQFKRPRCLCTQHIY